MNSNATYHLRALSLLLVVVCLFHFVFPVFFAVDIQIVKSEQQAIIKQKLWKHTVSVKMSTAQFTKHYNQEEHELTINNEVYDVVTVEHFKNSVHCTILPDKEETQLTRTVVDNIQHEKPNNGSKQLLLWQPLLCQIAIQYDHIPISPIVEQYICARNNGFIFKGYVQDITQPPTIFMTSHEYLSLLA